MSTKSGRRSRNIKVPLKCCSVIVALVALLSSSPSRALTIDFSFTNTIGNVSGTVSGEIDGLVDNAFSSATQVIIESAPSGLALTTPLVMDGSAALADDFLMSNGSITYALFDFSTANYQFCLSFANSGNCVLSELTYLVNSNSSSSVETDASPTFTSATPLPAALLLFAGGLGMTGLLGARKRRKAQAA